MKIRPYTELNRSEIQQMELRLKLPSCGVWDAIHEEALNAFRRRNGLREYCGFDLVTARALETLVIQGETDILPSSRLDEGESEAYITPHFRWEEFASKGDGVAVPEVYRANVRALCQQLEIIRRILGNRSMTIVSGWRSEWWNLRVGGYAYSAHKEGLAADFTVDGIPPSAVRRLIESLMERGDLYDGGLGRMAQFTHYDIAQSHERWN